jgi:hypothetical protein
MGCPTPASHPVPELGEGFAAGPANNEAKSSFFFPIPRLLDRWLWPGDFYQE